MYQPTAPRSRSFAGVCVTSANPLLQPRPTSAQRVHPMGIEIVPHPRVQYTDRRLISVDEDGFGTGRPVVPLSRSRCPVSRSCCPFPVSCWRAAAVGKSFFSATILAASMWSFSDLFAGNDGQRSTTVVKLRF